MRVTDDLLSVFYLATASHLFYMCLICFIIPESLTKASMAKARKRRKTSRADIAVEHGDVGSQDFRVTVRTRVWGFFRALCGFLAPLSIFLPVKRPEGGRDWNLTLLVFATICAGLLTASALRSRGPRYRLTRCALRALISSNSNMHKRLSGGTRKL